MSVRVLADKIYTALVNQVPGIRERYKRLRYGEKKGARVRAWFLLFGMNVAYHVFRYRKLGEIEKVPFYERKYLYTKGSESSLSKREDPESFAEELSRYDVISFDVFDTLVFRPFSSPEDLFYLMGDDLGYLDYKRIRMEMEWKARENKDKKEGHREVNLDEIYELLSEETGIEKEGAMRQEVELEYQFCFANPYMLRVVRDLRKRRKRLVVTSDMYLSSGQINGLLEQCGYPEFDKCYVSCDFGKSKSRGDLYDEVRKREVGSAKKEREPVLVHVGDNYVSDVLNARKHGFDSRHYLNVNSVGLQYRAEDMSAITGSLYRGIVNSHIHNGLKLYTREYEYGFIYGGLFVAGYCRFIHEYVNSHGTEKILFLARDGYVLKKAYEILYPEEKGKAEYVYWSRLAAVKMTAGDFKYDYFRRFLYHKINQGYRIEGILASMELEDLLEGMCKRTGCHRDTELTDRNVEKVKQYLMEHWEEVLCHYGEQLEAGRQYFRGVLGSCKKAVAVDIGWAGSGAIALGHLLNTVWKTGTELTGIIAGTNTCHNAEPDASETFLQSGRLVSYMYSQRKNRDVWKFHDAGKGHNLYWEMLLDAPHGSLKGFYLDDKGKWKCRFKEPGAQRDRVEEIQRGILEFVKEYEKVSRKSGLLKEIAGRDAYAAMKLVEEDKNKGFIKEIAILKDKVNVG